MKSLLFPLLTVGKGRNQSSTRNLDSTIESSGSQMT